MKYPRQDLRVTKPQLLSGMAERVRYGKHKHYNDACGNRRTFKVFHFACISVSECFACDVKACETTYPTTDKEGEANNIPETP